MKTYRAAVIGCSRMGAFIDNETVEAHPYTSPYSHAAGFAACDRTELIGCSDLRPDVMKVFGETYDVPLGRQFVDFKELIDRAQPDIISVATQPEQRSEIVVYAAEHGVKAIYAEKPMAASMSEADAMVGAVERNGVAFNLGARRRFWPGFHKMREIIASEELGALRSLVMKYSGQLFNIGSHTFDLALYLSGDQPVEWVQAAVIGGEDSIRDGVISEDPRAHGMIQFKSGVTAHMVFTPLVGQYEAICDDGIVGTLNDRSDFRIWRRGAAAGRGRRGLIEGDYPEFVEISPTTNIIEDLVRALDTSEPPRGGVRVARAGTELIFAFLESHLQGGRKVALPLEDSRLRLDRSSSAKNPTYSR